MSNVVDLSADGSCVEWKLNGVIYYLISLDPVYAPLGPAIVEAVSRCREVYGFEPTIGDRLQSISLCPDDAYELPKEKNEMSMSTYVAGFKPPDDKWKKMKEVWDACKRAEIDAPKEVMEYFRHEPPDGAGVEVTENDLVKCGAIVEYANEYRSGFELYIDKLPEDVKIIRFANSW